MISFFVHGLPRPAGSKRAFVMPGKFGGKPRAIVTDANPNAKDWKHEVKMSALEHRQVPLLDGPLAVEFVFYMPRTKGHFGSGRNSSLLKSSAPVRPITKPDLLKLARGVEDSLTGLIYGDDAQIVEEHLHKEYGERIGVKISVWAWGWINPSALFLNPCPKAATTLSDLPPA